MSEIPRVGPERDKYNTDRFCRDMVVAALDGFMKAYEEYDIAMNFHHVDPRVTAERGKYQEATPLQMHQYWQDQKNSSYARVYRKWFLLTAARQVYRYRDWALKREILDPSIFNELIIYEDDIKLLRDLNEHADEYFSGGGRRRDKWFHQADGGIADASSGQGGRIGNRLDPKDFRVAVSLVLEKIIEANDEWDGPKALAENIKRYEQHRVVRQKELIQALAVRYLMQHVMQPPETRDLAYFAAEAGIELAEFAAAVEKVASNWLNPPNRSGCGKPDLSGEG